MPKKKVDPIKSQMGRSSRKKGARGEREIVSILQQINIEESERLGMPVVDIQRNLQQYIKGGNDIRGLRGISLEVKFCEKFNLGRWWSQTLVQAQERNAIPVLIYKKSFVAWRVRMFGFLNDENLEVKALVDIDLETFLTFFRYRLRGILEEEKENMV